MGPSAGMAPSLCRSGAAGFRVFGSKRRAWIEKDVLRWNWDGLGVERVEAG